MLELLFYVLVVAPFLMSDKEKDTFGVILVIAAVIFGVASLFY